MIPYPQLEFQVMFGFGNRTFYVYPGAGSTYPHARSAFKEGSGSAFHLMRRAARITRGCLLLAGRPPAGPINERAGGRHKFYGHLRPL